MLAFFIIFIHRTKQGGKIMNVAEKLENTIEAVDFNPKLPIFIEELSVPSMNIYLYAEGNIPKAYYINHYLEHRKADHVSEQIAVYNSSFAVRLRALNQFPEIELFPNVSVDKIGNLREYMLKMLERESQNNETIDCKAFSELSYALWKKGNKQSFPIIKNLAPKDAKYSIQVCEKLKIEIKT